MISNHVKERTEIAIPERYISMSNSVARGAQDLSLPEKRMLAVGLAKTDSIPMKDFIRAKDSGWAVKITALEYAETFDVSPEAAYKQLKLAGDNLLKRHVKTMSRGRKGIIETKSQWVGQVQYHKKEGWIEFKFTQYVAPHLLGLRKNFTTYKLKQASALRSIYSWRLFECLQSWKSKGKWSVDVDDFAKAMDVPPSLQNDFGQIKRRVIIPAIKELREKDNYIVEIEYIKAGRKVTDLVFTFKPSNQMTLNLE